MSSLFRASAHNAGLNPAPAGPTVTGVGVVRRIVFVLLLVPASLLLLIWELIDPVNPLYSIRDRDDWC